MGIVRGPNIIKDGLVFGCDTGYPISDNKEVTRFYQGEPTTNEITTNLETTGADGSGQSSVGTRTTIAPNHVKIVDISSNTRQSHLISGLTASTIYTVSIQFKKITGTPTFRFQLQGYSGSSYVNTIKFTTTAETGLLDIYGWQTAKWTFTLPSNANGLRIWWQDGADYTTYTHAFELKNPQLEAKAHCTPYVSGTRPNTATLIDLKREKEMTLSLMTYDSTGQPDYDGTNDYVNLGNYDAIRLGYNFTIEAVVRPEQDKWMYFFHKGYGSNNSLAWGRHSSGDDWFFSTMVNGAYQNTYMGTATLNKYCHLVATYDGANLKLYENGVLKATSAKTHSMLTSSASAGIGGPDRYWNGKIPVIRVYNQVLSQAEVTQNYKINKNRFNI